jgi:predicted nucleic acid-binding protein
LASSRRDQKNLGIDSNVLIAYLVPDHPDHRKVKSIADKDHVVNPTVIHETYHTCIFKLRRDPEETVRVLLSYMKLAHCLPITEKTVELGLKLGLEHSLGGRDALILSSYLSSTQVSMIVTLDEALLRIKQVKSGGKTVKIFTPSHLDR